MHEKVQKLKKKVKKYKWLAKTRKLKMEECEKLVSTLQKTSSVAIDKATYASVISQSVINNTVYPNNPHANSVKHTPNNFIQDSHATAKDVEFKALKKNYDELVKDLERKNKEILRLKEEFAVYRQLDEMNLRQISDLKTEKTRIEKKLKDKVCPYCGY